MFSLIIYYDREYEIENFNLQTAGLPLQILRAPLEPQIALDMAWAFLEKHPLPNAVFTYVVEQNNENLLVLNQIFKEFGEKHHCKVEWHIYDAEFPEPTLEVAASNDMIVVFFEQPKFPLVNGAPDLSLEPPVFTMIVEGTYVDSIRIGEMVEELRSDGADPVYWIIEAATEERVQIWDGRNDLFVQDLNHCLTCMREERQPTCAGCQYLFIQHLAKDALSQGIPSIVSETKEWDIELERGEEE